MATRKNINASVQVKEINRQRWICYRVKMTESTTSADYDFIDNADGFLWKKVRPFKESDLTNSDISGTAQMIDDEISSTTNQYVNDGYIDDYFE